MFWPRAVSVAKAMAKLNNNDRLKSFISIQRTANAAVPAEEMCGKVCRGRNRIGAATASAGDL